MRAPAFNARCRCIGMQRVMPTCWLRVSQGVAGRSPRLPSPRYRSEILRLIYATRLSTLCRNRSEESSPSGSLSSVYSPCLGPGCPEFDPGPDREIGSAQRPIRCPNHQIQRRNGPLGWSGEGCTCVVGKSGARLQLVGAPWGAGGEDCSHVRGDVRAFAR